MPSQLTSVNRGVGQAWALGANLAFDIPKGDIYRGLFIHLHGTLTVGVNAIDLTNVMPYGLIESIQYVNDRERPISIDARLLQCINEYDGWSIDLRGSAIDPDNAATGVAAYAIDVMIPVRFNPDALASIGMTARFEMDARDLSNSTLNVTIPAALTNLFAPGVGGTLAFAGTVNVLVGKDFTEIPTRKVLQDKNQMRRLEYNSNVDVVAAGAVWQRALPRTGFLRRVFIATMLPAAAAGDELTPLVFANNLVSLQLQNGLTVCDATWASLAQWTMFKSSGAPNLMRHGGVVCIDLDEDWWTGDKRGYPLSQFEGMLSGLVAANGRVLTVCELVKVPAGV